MRRYRLYRGALYCFRAIYLNKCVYKRWDPDWHVWYFIRPITSTIAGAVSYLFLKAGLLVLESSANTDASEIGFFALAFIAGLNVDKFVAKIEEVAKAVWGIDKSRSSQPRTRENLENTPGALRFRPKRPLIKMATDLAAINIAFTCSYEASSSALTM